MEILLGHGVGIDDRIPQSGGTPLMLAAQEGHLLSVKYLIAQDANLDAINSDGETALLIAISENHSETADMLLHAGPIVALKQQLERAYFITQPSLQIWPA